MAWKIVYLVVFLCGLALAVNAMLHGASRWRRRSGTPSPVVNPPTIAALTAGFGAGGYLLFTHTSMNRWVVLVIAIAIGAVAFAAMTVLMAKWALRQPASIHEEEDVNGQVARVTREISAGDTGEITYFAWD